MIFLHRLIKLIQQECVGVWVSNFIIVIWKTGMWAFIFYVVLVFDIL